MICELFSFQKQAVNELRFRTAMALNNYRMLKIPQVVSLQAPTGSGKTIIMSALIEDILFGSDQFTEQQDAIFVWLSDSPQLNEQSKQKIELKADKIRLDQCVVVSDESFDMEVLEDGHIYFLNTQKLGKAGNLSRHSDTRQYTIWETIENTARLKSDRLYFIIDEAHRGMQGRQAGTATTIMQRFIKGSPEHNLSPVPVVIGMSATSERFDALVGKGTNSTLHKVCLLYTSTLAQSLGDRTDYAKNPEKTDKGELVTGYQCDPMTVDEEFMLSKRQYEQITGRRQRHEVIAYQIRQSFKPGEITPEEANRLGQELALRFTKGKYAFIVATHTDRAHVHNHIVFNSTSIDGTRKFKNFWLSSIALQRVSDLVCLENGLSVITPKPYRERAKRTDYPRRVKNRDVLCEDIDAVLQKKPESFEAFLQELQALDYEIKCGKHISVKGKNQARFIRLSSLEDGYTEADLRSHFLGQQEHKPREKRNYHTDVRPFNLVIDIQSKLQNKGAGYQRWASVYNLKQMSKTLLFLRDHKIESMEQLDQLVQQQTAKRDALLSSIHQSEKRLAEIGTLKKHIINYSKTRAIYEEYRKAGYSKKFLEAHRDEITIHKAAKAAFDELGVRKLPRVKDLSIESVSYTHLDVYKRQHPDRR